MSTVSSKFHHPSNIETFVFITHDANFNNLKLYKNGQQITTIANKDALQSGTSINTDDGEIELTLKAGTLQVRVNNQLYYQEAEQGHVDDIKGAKVIFVALAILAFMGTVISQFIYDFNLENEYILFQFIYDIFFTSLYAGTAILLFMNKEWGYFIGLGAFLVSSVLMLLTTMAFNWPITYIINLVIRLILILYIFTFLKNVLVLLKTNKGTDLQRLDVLDDF